MPSLSRLAVPVAAGLWAALAALPPFQPGPSRAQPPSGEPPRPADADRVASIAICANCHSGEKTPGYPKYRQDRITEYVTMAEYPVWEQRDPHAKSVQFLAEFQETPDGKRMKELLGYSRPLAMEPSCLACHATEVKAPGGTVDYGTADGVNCYACHGDPRGDWVGKHFTADFRGLAPAAKEAQGLTDLRSPRRCAEVCASCHVGDRGQGRFITHEMYAAGHPPLPAFEAATYRQFEPGHGIPASANAYFKGLSPDDCWERFHYRPGTVPQAREAALGAAVVLKKVVEALAEDARGAGDRGLDLANFDCYACHHDLKNPGWRQARGPGDAPPGRPRMRPVPDTFLRLVLEQARGPKLADDAARAKLVREFDGLLGALRQEFAAHPFGRPNEVAAAAAPLVKWLDGELLPALDGVEFTPAEAGRLADAVAARLRAGDPRARNGAFGYEDAQGLVWGYAALRGTVFDAPLTPEQPAPARGDPLRELDRLLGLTLRDVSRPPVSVLKLRPERQRRLSDYDPANLRAPFDALPAGPP